MAIAKVKTRKVEWTTAAIVQMSVAGVLVVLSLILGWVAVRKFGLKRSMANGLVYYDSNRIGNAVPALEDALAWNAQHYVARELLAKIKTDGGDLAGAEANYQILLNSDFPRKETVHCGLGVIALKKADKEKDIKGAEQYIKQAFDAFTLAKAANGAMPEAEIGLRHCELCRLVKTDGPGPYAPERVKDLNEKFDKILKVLSSNQEMAKSITREGLVDLYSGLGWTYGQQGRYDVNAARFFKACYQYAPRWVLPLINMVYVEAQRFFEGGGLTLLDLRAMESQIAIFSNEMKTKWSGQPTLYGGLKEPWFQYCLATAYAYASRDDVAIYRNKMHNLLQDPALSARADPHVVDAYVWLEKTAKGNPDITARNMFNDALGATLDNFKKHETLMKDTDAAKKMRATVYIGLGNVEEYRARRENRNERYDKAIEFFKESLKAEDTYEANRNIAVILRRRGKQQEAQEFYTKALDAESKGWIREWAKSDVDTLKKFWAGP